MRPDCLQYHTSYMRRNVAFVDYVQNPEQADVHLLGTRPVDLRRQRILPSGIPWPGSFAKETCQMNCEAAPYEPVKHSDEG